MQKWVLLLTLPSGSLWVLGEMDNGLALYPVQEGAQSLKQVFAFDSEEEAQTWIAETAKLSDKGRDLMEMTKPFAAEALQ